MAEALSERLGKLKDDDFAGGGSDRLFDAVVPSGNARAVAARVRERFDAGADHVCIQPLAEGRAVDLAGFRSWSTPSAADPGR